MHITPLHDSQVVGSAGGKPGIWRTTCKVNMDCFCFTKRSAPLISKLFKSQLCIYNEILFSHLKKNKESLPFVITWMKLEDTMLTKSERKINTIRSHSQVKSNTNKQKKTKKHQAHRKRDQICSCQRQRLEVGAVRERWSKGINFQF